MWALHEWLESGTSRHPEEGHHPGLLSRLTLRWGLGWAGVGIHLKGQGVLLRVHTVTCPGRWDVGDPAPVDCIWSETSIFHVDSRWNVVGKRWVLTVMEQPWEDFSLPFPKFTHLSHPVSTPPQDPVPTPPQAPLSTPRTPVSTPLGPQCPLHPGPQYSPCLGPLCLPCPGPQCPPHSGPLCLPRPRPQCSSVRCSLDVSLKVSPQEASPLWGSCSLISLPRDREN